MLSRWAICWYAWARTAGSVDVAPLQERLDLGVGVLGEVRGELEGGEDLRRAPPQVIEVGVHRARTVAMQGLVLTGQGVVDLVGLLDLVSVTCMPTAWSRLWRILGGLDG